MFAQKIHKGYLANRQVFNGLIGDDSKIRANVWIKKWEHKGKKGLSIWLSAFVITDLVEFQRDEQDELFEGLPDVGELPEFANSNSTPVGEPSKSFDVSDDDLPF